MKSSQLTDSEINVFVKKIRAEEVAFKRGISNPAEVQELTWMDYVKGKVKSLLFTFRSICDFVLLIILSVSPKHRRKRMVYSAVNFMSNNQGKFEDRFLRTLFRDDILYINTSKEVYFSYVGTNRVFNIGGIVKLINIFTRSNESIIKYFRAHQLINTMVLMAYRPKEVYLMWYYDTNSLSIIFSRFREKLKIIEVQHGSIINYPPYSFVSEVNLVDCFYVKNEQTVSFLQQNLCKKFDCEFRLIPKNKVEKFDVDGVHILYASTPDFRGLHPVFLDFLNYAGRIKNLNIKIRLHPRERNEVCVQRFRSQMSDYQVVYEFDESSDMIIGNPLDDLIVVSPWSSSIEDAYEANITSVIIDNAGKERFSHLIDNEKCFYSNSLFSTLKLILPQEIDC